MRQTQSWNDAERHMKQRDERKFTSTIVSKMTKASRMTMARTRKTRVTTTTKCNTTMQTVTTTLSTSTVRTKMTSRSMTSATVSKMAMQRTMKNLYWEQAYIWHQRRLEKNQNRRERDERQACRCTLRYTLHRHEGLNGRIAHFRSPRPPFKNTDERGGATLRL